MLASAKLKESNKGGFDTTVPGTLYCSYPVLPFGIVACKSDNLSRNSCICMYFYLKAFQISSQILTSSTTTIAFTLKKIVSLLKAILNVDVNLVLQNRVSLEVTFYRKQNLR